MEINDILEKGVGNIEMTSLKPAPVVITGMRIDSKEKNGKHIGNIVKFICKHPEKDELIEIGQVKYLKNDTVKYSGTWINFDEEQNIQKGSAVAILLDFCKVANLKELDGKTDVQTDMDKNGFLCLKAY